jgi:signal transduction histidine kinase
MASVTYGLHKVSAPFQQERETLGSDVCNSPCIDLNASQAESQAGSRNGRGEMMPWLKRVIQTGFLALGRGLSRLRVHPIAHESNFRAEGRLDERRRLARELHDTLLQTFQASLVQMQVARNLLSRRPGEAVQNLDDAIKMAAIAIAEGRDAIQGLRCQATDQGDLEKMLSVAGQELACRQEPMDYPVRFRVIVEGQRQPLKLPVQEEVYQIGRELLRNAFRHARASRVEAEIRYHWRLLAVHVRDDGKGIDPEILKAVGSDDHWGFVGVRERTKRIGGRLVFWSKRGAGTEVRLAVPASVAYAAVRERAGFSSFINHLMPFTRR